MTEKSSNTWQRVLVLSLVLFTMSTITAVFATHLEAQTRQSKRYQMTPSPLLRSNTIITATATITPTATPSNTNFATLHLPLLFKQPLTALPAPRLVSGEPPIDFSAAKAQAQAQGLDIAFNKIGFHVGVGGNRDGLMESIMELDAAGVPVFLKTVNDAEPVYLTQEMMKKSGVPHNLVYRDVDSVLNDPADFSLPAAEVAEVNWQYNKDNFPPELDPSLIWLETINEPGRIHSTWLAEFALAQAKMAVTDGYKYAAFGWSSGVPEPEDWELPAMLEFLRYAGDHPESVAIALHEYSLQREFIASGDLPYPYTLGRFQNLFEICDKYDIPRPTILITEWGWTQEHVAGDDDGVDIAEAMEDIRWASSLYAAYPQVKGAAIWYLGESDNFGKIDDEAQQLIAPVHDFSLSSYFVIHPGKFPIDDSLFVPNPPTTIER